MEASESLDILTTDFKKQIRILANQCEKLIKINDQMLIFEGMKRKFSQDAITIMNKINSIIQKINSQLNIQLQEIQIKSQQNQIKSQQKQTRSNIKFFFFCLKQQHKMIKIEIDRNQKIKNKYSFIREFSFGDIESFETEIVEQLEDIYEKFKQQRLNLGNNENQELQIMMVKCLYLHNIDKVLNGTQNFKNLATQIQRQISSTFNRFSNNLKTFINVLNIAGIRREFKKFKNESQSQEMKEMHRQSKIDLEHKVCQLIEEIKKKKISRDQQSAITEEFEYLEKITELMSLQEFLEQTIRNNLCQLRHNIVKDFTEIFILEIKEIESLLSDYSLQTVIKKLKKIQQQFKNYDIKFNFILHQSRNRFQLKNLLKDLSKTVFRISDKLKFYIIQLLAITIQIKQLSKIWKKFHLFSKKETIDQQQLSKEINQFFNKKK